MDFMHCYNGSAGSWSLIRVIKYKVFQQAQFIVKPKTWNFIHLQLFAMLQIQWTYSLHLFQLLPMERSKSTQAHCQLQYQESVFL